MVGTIASPLLTGWCFDVYGDYRLAWIVMACTNFAVIPMTLKIKAPKRSGEANRSASRRQR
jgi:cyanate permease